MKASTPWFDAETNEYVDMMQAGIIDPADDYLGVRQPAWNVLEKAGAVETHAG